MSDGNPVRCILCGGDHAPQTVVCDEAGMDREIERMGPRLWTRLSREAWKPSFKAALAELRALRAK
jgi:hypothetical protein